jgi:hypothetical protein
VQGLLIFSKDNLVTLTIIVNINYPSSLCRHSLDQYEAMNSRNHFNIFLDSAIYLKQQDNMYDNNTEAGKGNVQ